ncbi:MAG: monovalent cation/H(+) antiporter subunit G [Oscillospiraceae bacterium]|nr:monovalent cation/H(+) antiporter subunit G [Oscillospiraceae bacterium]MCL2279697.1 monovalent cation/H(+) antiporter subunit G [Oscillospiraceae bacterium]
MVFGAVGLFRFKDFYPRILIASKIDTVGLLTILIGVALRHGISFFTGKVALIIVVILVLNPLVAHIVASAAQESGYGLEGTLAEEGDSLQDSEKLNEESSNEHEG